MPMMVACSIGCLLFRVARRNSSTLARSDAVRGGVHPIILACAAGHNNKTVARRLRLSPATVGKWRAHVDPPDHAVVLCVDE